MAASPSACSKSTVVVRLRAVSTKICCARRELSSFCEASKKATGKAGVGVGAAARVTAGPGVAGSEGGDTGVATWAEVAPGGGVTLGVGVALPHAVRSASEKRANRMARFFAFRVVPLSGDG